MTDSSNQGDASSDSHSGDSQNGSDRRLGAETPVLIVDDNPQYSMVLEKTLRSRFGFDKITVLDNLAAAYSLLHEKQGFFKLLFVDYNFPSVETGGDLLTKLSKEGQLEGIVAFLITSEPSVDNLKQAKAAGALGVVAKPFDRQELARQLEKAERLLLVEDTESF